MKLKRTKSKSSPYTVWPEPINYEAWMTGGFLTAKFKNKKNHPHFATLFLGNRDCLTITIWKNRHFIDSSETNSWFETGTKALLLAIERGFLTKPKDMKAALIRHESIAEKKAKNPKNNAGRPKTYSSKNKQEWSDEDWNLYEERHS